MPETVEYNRLKELLLGDETAANGQIGLLKVKGLSIEEFARLSKLTRTSLYYYLGGKRKPSRESVIRMARVLEMEPEELSKHIESREPGRPTERR